VLRTGSSCLLEFEDVVVVANNLSGGRKQWMEDQSRRVLDGGFRTPARTSLVGGSSGRGLERAWLQARNRKISDWTAFPQKRGSRLVTSAYFVMLLPTDSSQIKDQTHNRGARSMILGNEKGFCRVTPLLSVAAGGTATCRSGATLARLCGITTMGPAACRGWCRNTLKSGSRFGNVVALDV
jgi:hypothetical protein